MLSMKQYRDNELKFQENLYENLYLLTQFYPPSDEFKVHFKRDMFVNKNKAGFYQVVYYLLSVLNPELTKQKLSSWPPYDIRHESKFRLELIQYITELNSLYENADIPVLMTSHLITPGGMKCLRFLLKLSHLVMFQHLNKTPDVRHLLVHNLKNTKSKEMTDAYINKLKTLTRTIEEETRSVHDDFRQMLAKMMKTAQELVEKKREINANLAKVSEEHQKIRKNCSNSPDSSPLLDVRGKFDDLKKEIASISDMKTQFERLESLITYIVEERNILTIDKDALNLPKDIDCIFSTDSEEFDLVQFLNALHIFLEKMSLHIPHLPSGYLTQIGEKVAEINESYSSLNKRADKLHEEVMKLSEKLPQLSFVDNQDNPQIVLNIRSKDLFDLAMPLGNTS